jgi:hypothetical protein
LFDEADNCAACLVQAQAARLDALQTTIDLVKTKLDKNSTDMRDGFAAILAKFLHGTANQILFEIIESFRRQMDT